MYGQPVGYGGPTPEMAIAANMAMNTPAPMMAPPPPPMMMGAPMGYAPAPGPTIVTIAGNNGGTKCPFCSQNTGNIPRKRSGCVTWAWCACLFFFTGACCFIPFCVDSCKDIQQVCQRCSNVKNVIPANCC